MFTPWHIQLLSLCKMSGSVAQWRYRTKIVATIDLVIFQSFDLVVILLKMQFYYYKVIVIQSFTGVVAVLVGAVVIAVIVKLLYTPAQIGPELQTSSYPVFNQSTGQWNFPANSPQRKYKTPNLGFSTLYTYDCCLHFKIDIQGCCSPCGW